MVGEGSGIEGGEAAKCVENRLGSVDHRHILPQTLAGVSLTHPTWGTMDEPLTPQQFAAHQVLAPLIPMAEAQVRRLTPEELEGILKANNDREVRAVLADAYVRMANAARAEAKRKASE